MPPVAVAVVTETEYNALIQRLSLVEEAVFKLDTRLKKLEKAE